MAGQADRRVQRLELGHLSDEVGLEITRVCGRAGGKKSEEEKDESAHWHGLGLRDRRNLI